ncbi:MAG: hypothetical protein CMJ52_03695 [Planctomycetaceae bacterium]|nr:hypothetical protein [Planctomycetaceae bacterium]
MDRGSLVADPRIGAALRPPTPNRFARTRGGGYRETHDARPSILRVVVRAGRRHGLPGDGVVVRVGGRAGPGPGREGEADGAGGPGRTSEGGGAPSGRAGSRQGPGRP